MVFPARNQRRSINQMQAFLECSKTAPLTLHDRPRVNNKTVGRTSQSGNRLRASGYGIFAVTTMRKLLAGVCVARAESAKWLDAFLRGMHVYYTRVAARNVATRSCRMFFGGTAKLGAYDNVRCAC